MPTYLIAAVLAFVVSILLTPVARRLAFRLGSVHYPKSISIETHVEPIPYLGGLPIFLAFNLVCTIFFVLSGDFQLVLPLLTAATIVAIGGIIDDARPLSVLGKFIAQVLATIFILMTGSALLRIPAFTGVEVLDTVVAFILIVGVMNAINFLDIMDGLAGGVAMMAALAFVILGVLQGNLMLAVMAASLLGAAAGFLVFNFNPARIFMGDTGSQFLGFILALFPPMMLLQAPTGTRLQVVVVTLIALGVPIFEMTFTTTIRSLTGKKPWKGSKDHFALRMFAMGYTVRQIVLATYAVGLVLAIIAALLFNASWSAVVWTVVGLVVVALGISLWLSRVHVPKPNAAAQFANQTNTVTRRAATGDVKK